MKNIFYLFVFLPGFLSAQFNFERNNDVPVTSDGSLLQLAWVGGYNNPQFSNIDINMDNVQDLFVFDRSGDVPLLFLTTIQDGNVVHTPVFELLDNFPKLDGWAVLADYNLDGKADLFTHSSSIPGGGIAVYKNISTADNLAFELVSELLFSHAEFETSTVDFPLFVNIADIPSFIDIDNDGDMDILTFAINGAELEYHENQSQENWGDNEHLEYELKNACWGYFKESSLDNSISLFDTCLTNVINPKSSVGNDAIHVGSTVLGLDLNGDGVKDLLIGDITGTNLIALVNGGTTQSGIMVEQFPNFPVNNVGVDIVTFPSPYFVDVDGDNINDLVISPNAPNTSNNFSSIWLYKNAGNNSTPVFEFVESSFMQDQMIERGSNALPVIFDYNADNKPDLFVANKSFYDNNSNQQSKLALYKNVGNNGNIAFELVDDNYLNLSELGLGLALYPTFGDLDNDGDKDLIIGDLTGQLHYFENIAGAGNTADFVLAQPGITDANGEVIDVGQFATPFLIDIDRNGTTDLVIGERNGNLNYYKNTGTPESYEFSLITENFGGIDLPGDLNEGFAVPLILDSDEGYHLFLGSELGNVLHYFPIEDNLNGDFNLANENILPFYEGKRPGIAMGDLSNSPGLEMIVGNLRGGVGFYNTINPDGISENENLDNLIRLYPNPTSGIINLITDVEFIYDLKIINLIGQVLVAQKNLIGNQQLNVNNLPAGMYIIQVDADNRHLQIKFVKE
jgi:hypothetical protein